MNRKCKLTSLSLSLVASLATATVPAALAAGSEKPRYTL
jgi:hypothetical protein